MNFACALSLRVEEIMDEIRPMPTEDEIADWIWTDDDEGEVYDEALQRALEETNGVVSRKPRLVLAGQSPLTNPFTVLLFSPFSLPFAPLPAQAWASGNIRMSVSLRDPPFALETDRRCFGCSGEYILIIDSIPVCLRCVSSRSPNFRGRSSSTCPAGLLPGRRL